MYKFKFKHGEIVYNDKGFREWQTVENIEEYKPSEIALVIVDMWDKHWSKGATYRCGILADKINAVAERARKSGIFIVHAPSDTMAAYENTPARNRALDIELSECVETVEIKQYSSPIDASDGGSDSIDENPPNTLVWKKQTDKIIIDHTRDIISDEGKRIYSHFKKRGIKLVLYAGVHTNMCILGRSFAIMQMLRYGLKTALIRDLTDAMYNPEKPPYVGHDEGTQLVIGYIEKFYCPTIDSSQILGK